MRKLSVCLALITAIFAASGVSAQATGDGPRPESWEGFRATGNEPFWSLRIDDGMMRFELLSAFAADAPLPEDEFTPNGRIFMGYTESAAGTVPANTVGRAFIVLVENDVCYDDMSGRPYPKTVRVFVAGGHFTGCGGESADLLTVGEWQIYEIAGSERPEGVTSTILFAENGQVSGYTGCNRFTGSYSLGEGLDFGLIGTTRRACLSDEASRWEAELLHALGRVIMFEIGEDGELRLGATDGIVIEAARPR